ncbi:hypothetical protein EMCRGX_G017234 [Ephydatia muelleri]
MASYNVPEGKCTVCKRDQKHYYEDCVDSTTLEQFKLTADAKKPDHFYYGVRIVTGAEAFSGTPDSDIYVSLVGSKGCTGKLLIVQGWFSSAVSTQSYDDLVVESDKDLGELLVVILGNPQNWMLSAGSAWFVDFVECIDLQTKRKQEFPCYHWINDGDAISFTSKTATMKDVKQNQILCIQREKQLEQRKTKYQWLPFPDLAMPSGIDDRVSNLPSDEEFGAVRTLDFLENALTGKGTMMLKAKLASIEALSDFEKLATALGMPTFVTHHLARWTRDEEFGRQILNGVNPVMIKKCVTLPPNFPVTTAMVHESLVRGLSLEDEMMAGHIYICDYKILDGLPCKDGWFCAAPICLLYVNKKKDLIPIAIQLKQKPGSDNPIFLPTDNWADWTLAKMYYQSACTQYHQIATHYLPCHAATEVYGMGVMRNLPDAHPIFKLLRPHFRYTMAINTKGRLKLMNDGGTVDRIFAIGGEGRRQLMYRGGMAYNIHCTNIKRSVQERGVDDPNILPGYYYRDDGLKIWHAIEDYVTDVLNEFYSSDGDVKNDPELQNFARDIYMNGFPGHHGSQQGHGFPNVIETKTQLVELCTLIIFNASAQHAAVNFGQYEIYSFSPNSPTGLRLPAPTVKGEANLKTILDALPDLDTAGLAIAVAHMLSQYSPDECFLGSFYGERFGEKKVQCAVTKFVKTLANIEDKIKERNKSLDVPYEYLLPSKVPNTIAI